MGAVVVVAAGLAAPSCAPPAIEGGFDSGNPAARMYAIEQAARDGDRTALPRIVEQLDSDDPAVRYLAITSLERLTGERLGYRFYDDPIERDLAIRRWVEYVQEREPSLDANEADGSEGDG
jgi:hypothetical protein